MKLEIMLVPHTAWYKNLRSLIKPSQWRKIKDNIKEKEGSKCWICGAPENKRRGRLGYMYLHEWWSYDIDNGIQKLEALHHVCWMCHAIIHIGRTKSTNDGLDEMNQLGVTEKDLIEHFCKVSKCSINEWQNHYDEAWKKWHERNNINWKREYGKYKRYVTNVKKQAILNVKEIMM